MPYQEEDEAPPDPEAADSSRGFLAWFKVSAPILRFTSGTVSVKGFVGVADRELSALALRINEIYILFLKFN